ncbi:hypothetical protein LTR94_032392, partial [Friedmanniomyces endolithicus]
ARRVGPTSSTTASSRWRRPAAEMAWKLFWRSDAGGRTEDNRDACGVGLRKDGMVCLVLDGATRRRDSGPFAREIARDIVEWYVESDEAIDADAVISRLADLHSRLAPRYPQASASYVLVHLDGSGVGFALHVGDCLLGRSRGDGPIEWLSRPDTLANALAANLEEA